MPTIGNPEDIGREVKTDTGNGKEAMQGNTLDKKDSDHSPLRVNLPRGRGTKLTGLIETAGLPEEPTQTRIGG